MLQEKKFDTGVVRLNYAEGPESGPPLVLLHGGGGRWQQFLPLMPSLVMRWHVFALDLRGHGQSGRVAGAYRPEQYGQDVAAFLERHVAGRAILFGHSLGGWVALLVAAHMKESIEALILGDPPLDMDRFLANEGSQERIDMWRQLQALAGSDSTVPEMAAALADAPFSGSELGWAKALRQADPDGLQYHVEGRLEDYVQQMDLEGSLRQLGCPVLLVQGDPSQGGYVSDADVERAMALLANGVYARLEGQGHNLGVDTWEVAPLLRAVVNFLESM